VDNDTTGPVDYVVVEFPDGAPTAEGFARLLAAVGRGAIRILDLEFVAADGSGGARVVDAATLDADVVGPFAGASAGLLDASDLDVLASEVAPGALAAVLVYEELSLAPALAAWRDGGARVVATGQLTEADIVAALDATDAD